MPEADGLGKSFRGRTVLKAAGFAARRRRITALMGRNGAGKSTMLRIAVGRVRAAYGRVMYRGRYLPRPSLPAWWNPGGSGSVPVRGAGPAPSRAASPSRRKEWSRG